MKYRLLEKRNNINSSNTKYKIQARFLYIWWTLKTYNNKPDAERHYNIKINRQGIISSIVAKQN